MARPATSLEALAEQHQRAVAAGNGSSAAPLRMKARTLAAKLGVPVPAWAAARAATPKPRGTSPLVAFRDASKPEAVPALASKVPPELSAWRARHSHAGSYISIGVRVVLATLADRWEFASLADAVAFAVAV